MAFGGATDTTKIVIELDASGAVKGYGDLATAQEKITQGAESVSTGFSSLQAKLVTLNSVVQLSKDVFSVLGSSLNTVFSTIKQGSNVADITQSFQNLSKQAGVTGDVLLNKLNAALANTVPNLDLMRKANELLIGGLKPQQIETVAVAARALGEATGVDAAQGMDQLADSLLRGNDRALKSLGIIIDTEKVTKDYAASIGKLTGELTEQERVFAIREASLAALAEKQQELGEVTEDAGDNIDQLTKVLEDAKNEFAAALATNEELNKALKELAELVKSIDFAGLIKQVVSFTTATAKAAKGVFDFIRVGGGFDAAIVKSLPIYQAYQEELRQVVDILGKDTPEATKAAARELDKIIAIVQSSETQGLAGALAGDIKDLQEQVTSFAKAQGILKDVTKVTTQELEANDEIVKKEVVSLARNTNEHTINRAARVAQKDATKDQLDLIDQLIENYRKEEAAIGRQIDALDGLERQSVEAFETATAAQTQLLSTFEEVFGKGIGNIITAALSGTKEDIKTSVKGLGAELGQVGGAALGGIIGGPIGAAIGGALGQAAGQSLGKGVFDAFNHVFGGRDAEGKVRDTMDKFFAEVLKNNPVQAIIEGQLQSISDLNFGRDTDIFNTGTFDDFLQNLPGVAQQAFSGVGIAFEQFFDNASDISGQLAAILANNLGGSLNNLQLLVEASGKSFEELRSTVIEAFLDGKLSIAETNTALSGLQQIAEKGIPGAVGDIKTAFQNLQAAGVKGGRALIDALQDIGFEAKELGNITLEQVMEQLKNTADISAESVDKLFAALQASGITTLDKLTSATVEELLPALGQLDATKFPFAEAVNQVEDLISKVESLPNKIEKRIVFNVTSNIDSNTDKLIKSGAIQNPGFNTGGPGVATN